MKYEEELYDSLIYFLEKRFGYMSWQVPALNGRIDLVAISKRNRVIAIEVKTIKWLEAVGQVLEYSMCADYAYIAVPERIAEMAMRRKSLFARSGVGLISVGLQTRIVIKAKKCRIQSKKLRRGVLSIVRKRRKLSLRRIRARSSPWSIKAQQDISCIKLERAIVGMKKAGA